MSKNVPAVFVAATVITTPDKKILAVYNPLWGSYTLPMTKQRAHEEWRTAAIRAATECLDVLFSSDSKLKDVKPNELLAPPELYLRTGGHKQSDRSEEKKTYHFQVFGLELESKPLLAPGIIAKWLTVDRFLDKKLEPISWTARYLIERLDTIAVEQNTRFPHRTITWPEEE